MRLRPVEGAYARRREIVRRREGERMYRELERMAQEWAAGVPIRCLRRECIRVLSSAVWRERWGDVPVDQLRVDAARARLLGEVASDAA